MIIWLASYPKSGNTWIRVIISNIINSKEKKSDEPFRFMHEITAYPSKSHFYNLVKNFDNLDEIISNYLDSQRIINSSNNIKIFKTHNMLGSFGKHKFTDINNTAGVIHIVRDPRNVVSSIHNHYQLDNINTAKKFILAKDNWIYATKGKKIGVLPNFISSWQMHYLSWKTFPKNYLFIKYEDLLEKPMDQIIKIYNFLKKFYDLDLSNEDLIKINEISSFNNLKKKEEESGFEESLDDNIAKKKIKFFHSGPSNNWEEKLDENVRFEIEKEFGKEMKELGYI